MKCRVFKKLDGGVIYSWPSSKYQEIYDFKGCKFPPESDGLSYVDLERSELPESRSSTGNYHEMIYFDGIPSKDNLKQDKDWEVMVMPVFLIKQKHIERLNTKIDAELLNANADPLAIMDYQRQKEKCQDFTDKQWYQQAVENMDEDNVVKQTIRDKLKVKIDALP